MKHKIVLYNPRAVFFTMPLSLLAIGSRLDPSRYEVKVVDGRLEHDPVAVVKKECADALLLGVTVLTGAPIQDALEISRAAKSARPDLPIIWGGWHPSLFPAQCLQESSVDAAVIGQGEDTFAELVDRTASGSSWDGLAGCTHRSGGEIRHEAPRPLADLNAFPPLNYPLVDVERYFVLKRSRQLDYISSQGCRFRCTFCADPYVYNRSWQGLSPERVGEELEEWWRRYSFQDVGFQDETLFTSAPRVEAMAGEFLRRGLKFTWTGTMRADQGFRLPDRLLAECKLAGLRRVMIGVEAGTQEMLDRIKKDIKLEQVFESAAKCLRHGIGVIFNIIVGFPEESPESIAGSLQVAQALRAMSPDFEIAVFYFKPYPGNPIADDLARIGYQFPETLQEWSRFDYVGAAGPWVSPETRELVEHWKFYQRIGWSRPSLTRAPLQALARWRCETGRFQFPIEKALVDRVHKPARLS